MKPVSLATILPAVVMERNVRKPTGCMRDKWWGSLGATLDKWRDPATVRETAKIVGRIALPECGQEAMGIAPDESVSMSAPN